MSRLSYASARDGASRREHCCDGSDSSPISSPAASIAQAQRDAASQYLDALFNDSERKSMQAMHGRLSDPGSYEALQHFITDSPWEAAPLWTRLRSARAESARHPGRRRHEFPETRPPLGGRAAAVLWRARQDRQLPGRGVDGPARRSPGVAPQLRAVPAAVAWCTDAARRTKARVPEPLRFREKWRIALAHIRQVLKAGFQLTAVVTDADYGARTAFRRGLERLGLRYGIALPSTAALWTAGARRTRTAAAIGGALPEAEWHRVTWAEGTKGPLAARFAAVRVRPAKSRGDRWLLCERSLADDARKYYLLNLDATASLHDLVTRGAQPLADRAAVSGAQRRTWASTISKGRSYRGWTHHTVLTAIAFTFLQLERRRSDDESRPTLPTVRLWVREIMAVLYVVTNRKLLNLLASFQRNPPLRR